MGEQVVFALGMSVSPRSAVGQRPGGGEGDSHAAIQGTPARCRGQPVASGRKQSSRLVWLEQVSSGEGGKSGGQTGSEGLGSAGPSRPLRDSGLYSREAGGHGRILSRSGPLCRPAGV